MRVVGVGTAGFLLFTLQGCMLVPPPKTQPDVKEQRNYCHQVSSELDSKAMNSSTSSIIFGLLSAGALTGSTIASVRAGDAESGAGDAASILAPVLATSAVGFGALAAYYFSRTGDASDALALAHSGMTGLTNQDPSAYAKCESAYYEWTSGRGAALEALEGRKKELQKLKAGVAANKKTAEEAKESSAAADKNSNTAVTGVKAIEKALLKAPPPIVVPTSDDG